MCGRNPAHYTEYWKAVQEFWLRLYLSNLVLVAAINVSAPTPEWPQRTGWGWGDVALLSESPQWGRGLWGNPQTSTGKPAITHQHDLVTGGVTLVPGMGAGPEGYKGASGGLDPHFGNITLALPAEGRGRPLSYGLGTGVPRRDVAITQVRCTEDLSLLEGKDAES